jgi:hypothetical protein
VGSPIPALGTEGSGAGTVPQGGADKISDFGWALAAKYSQLRMENTWNQIAGMVM